MSLKDKLDRERERREEGFPDSWKPDAGDVIEGKFVSHNMASTKYGDVVVMVLEDENGVRHSVWTMHTALRKRMAELRPRIGDTLAIQYEGMVEGQRGGNSFHSYLVVSDREAQPESDTPDFGDGRPPERQVDDQLPDLPHEAEHGSQDDIPF